MSRSHQYLKVKRLNDWQDESQLHEIRLHSEWSHHFSYGTWSTEHTMTCDDVCSSSFSITALWRVREVRRLKNDIATPDARLVNFVETSFHVSSFFRLRVNANRCGSVIAVHMCTLTPPVRAVCQCPASPPYRINARHSGYSRQVICRAMLTSERRPCQRTYFDKLRLRFSKRTMKWD